MTTTPEASTSESFEKAVKAASLAMLGRSTMSATTVRAALRAAIPHLTAEDVPHVIRQAKAEAWDEGYRASGIVYPTHPPKHPTNPYAEYVPNLIRQAKAEAWGEGWHAGAGWPQDEHNPYAEDVQNLTGGTEQ